ncbi:DUF309 domain-containing protein [Oceanicola sp. D3]|uniref:DUF309 domain-containing protein n=1 Tax=Oceanicola sp. D3 TaxID=2587163 RepID=UPI00143D13D1|nr:DUF309 domain-containing protein [Oceanicola sp. D3]
MSATPEYAYVPGQTARHPEGAFDGLRATAEPKPLASEALTTGLDWIDAGYFWEAHEVLEPVWLALPDGAARTGIQALIQLANAGLKARMERPAAALRLCDIAARLIDEAAPFTAPSRPAGWFTLRLEAIRERALEMQNSAV